MQPCSAPLVVLDGLPIIGQITVVLHSLLIVPQMPTRTSSTTAAEKFPKSFTKSSLTYRHNAY